jgi:hypothetical protein
MKYQAPYGVSDPNAAYINGNPSTGTMGSIPPAGSIEFPQREVVNFISDSSLTPTDADLHQLSRAAQWGKVNYVQDAGTANFIAVTPTPAIASYLPGMHFRIKVANANTGPTKLNVNGVGFSPVVRANDQSELAAGDLFLGQIIEVTWDGTHWQILSGISGGGPTYLIGPRDFYVNGTTGDDTAYDGTQATVDTPNGHGPFKTLQRAQNQTYKYNLNGYSINIHVADGTYTNPTFPGACVGCGVNNGSGMINYIGNTSNPAAVVLTSSQGMAISAGGAGCSVSFNGFRLTSTGDAPGWVGGAVAIYTGAYVTLYKIQFGPCLDYHISMEGGGANCSYQGPFIIDGGTVAHILATQGAYIRQPLIPPTLTITGPVNIGTFIAAQAAQTLVTYSVINGYGNVNGNKFSASMNGIILTAGAGVNYYPGTVAGATATGGQYG